MSKRLLVLNVLLAGASLLCVAFIVEQLAASRPAPRSRARPLARTVAAPETEAPRPPAAAYNVVATRNLFSPTRSEAPGTGIAGGGAMPVAKLNLHGVVLREGSPIAYLEDPLTKRVAGYRLGDAIAGGTVETISADHVVITRPEGTLDVRLRDPSKPRPPAPPVTQPPGLQPPGLAPGIVPPQVPGPQPVPGAIPPRALVPPPMQSVQPPPGVQQAPQPQLGVPNLPRSRPSPSLGRRLPASPADDATPKQ